MSVMPLILSILILSLSVILVFNLITKLLRIPDFTFNASLSLLVTLGILQVSALWFQLLFGRELSRLNSILLLLVVNVSLIIGNYIKRKDDFVRQAPSRFETALIALPLLILMLAIVSGVKLGDSGWDSNAYHIPIIGMLIKWGSNDWSESLSEGTFTIFSPYGAHSVKALFVSFSSDFQLATLPTGALYLGGVLIGCGLMKTKVTKIALVTSIALIPSVFGQLTRNYVDIWAGLYLFGGIVVFAKSYDSEITDKTKLRLTLISLFIVSLSVSSKTQSIITGVLFLFMVGILRIYETKMLDYKTILRFMTVFFLSASVPYIRNLLDFGNPVYPIINAIFPQGTIGISDLSNSVNSFRPVFWPQQTFLDPLLSVISPIWVLVVMTMSRLGIRIDSSRLDLSAFSYDTTTGGSGILLSLFLIASLFAILINFYTKKIIQPKQNIESNRILAVSAILIMVSIPSVWYPRYGMAFYLVLLILSLRYLENLTSSKLILFILFIGAVPSTLGLMVFQSYDLYSNQRNVHFSSKFGIDSPPKSFSEDCSKVAIIEPRPTFTSFIWESNCSEVISLPASANSYPENFFLVSNKLLGLNKLGDRKICKVHAWFDPNSNYGSYLYAPIGFKKAFCNPPSYQ
jgi:hypothetical protein